MTKAPYSATPEELRAIDEALGELSLVLTNGEREALVEVLRETIDTDRYPFSPRIKTLKAVLAKLAPPPPAAEPYPALMPSKQPSLALAKKRRR